MCYFLYLTYGIVRFQVRAELAQVIGIRSNCVNRKALFELQIIYKTMEELAYHKKKRKKPCSRTNINIKCYILNGISSLV